MRAKVLEVRAGIVCIGGAMLGLCASAHAQPASLALQWSPASDDIACIDVTSVTDSLREHVGASALGEPDQAARVVEVTVERVASELTLTLVLRDHDGLVLGERELHAAEDDCATLRDAAVLAIAVMAGPESPPAEPAQVPEPLTPAVAPVAARVAGLVQAIDAEPRPRAARTSYVGRFELAIGSAFTDGIVPQPAFHAALFSRLALFEQLAFELSLVFLGQGDAAMSGPFNGGAHFVPLYGVLTACPLRWETPAGRISACAGALAGVLLAQSYQAAASGNAVEPLAGAVVRVPCTIPLPGAIKLSAAATLGTPLVYRSVDVVDPLGGLQRLWRTPPLFASVELGVGLEL
jgi:hypothetical protein